MIPTPKEVLAARQSLELTQAQCAELIHSDRVTWARYEGGTRQMGELEWRYFRHVAGIERIPFRAARKVPRNKKAAR